VYEFLFDELDACGGTVLIVLNEADHIGDDSLLYNLPRARSNGDISDARRHRHLEHPGCPDAAVLEGPLVAL
jgi:Cdc6-like AAA superfamily ATPase